MLSSAALPGQQGATHFICYSFFRFASEKTNNKKKESTAATDHIQAPHLEDKPSTYIRRFFFCTQPIEEPDDVQDLVTLMRLFGGEDNVMFASDWPHHDFDHPSKALQLPLSLEGKKKLMGGNATPFFNLQER